MRPFFKAECIVTGATNTQSMLDADCSACNAADVAAADAKVVQFAVAHAAQFSYGLTILAPVVQRASDVHDRFLLVICAAWDRRSTHFLKPNIIGLVKTKTDNGVCHLCTQCIAGPESSD